MAAAPAAVSNSREPLAKIADSISAFRPQKIFKPTEESTSITSLDFDDTGEFLVAACDDETLQLYNCREGKHVKTLFSKKYGAHLARFTHHSQSVLYASTKENDTIRYLSTHDNLYLRYFQGHKAKVTSISVAPDSDTFVSCSLDNTVRLWALETSHSTGKLTQDTPYLSAFDPSGQVLAIGSTGTSAILLYDMRNYEKGAFSIFDMAKYETAYPYSAVSAHKNWTKLEFSNDGKKILLGTLEEGHFLIDAFSGELQAFCQRRDGTRGRLPADQAEPRATTARSQGDVCFAPDGRHVVGGSGSENLFVWDTQAEADDKNVLQPTHELEFRGAAAVVAFNPRLSLCATANKDVVFWLPDKGILAEGP